MNTARSILVSLTMLSLIVIFMVKMIRIAEENTITVLKTKYDAVDTNSWHKVVATTYYPDRKQTDNSPYGTASGMKISKTNPISGNIIALSRDMLKNFNTSAPFGYGDTVAIVGDCPYAGLWIVGDCTNKRLSHIIDFCVGKTDSLGKWTNVYISKFTRQE